MPHHISSRTACIGEIAAVRSLHSRKVRDGLSGTHADRFADTAEAPQHLTYSLLRRKASPMCRECFGLLDVSLACVKR